VGVCTIRHCQSVACFGDLCYRKLSMLVPMRSRNKETAQKNIRAAPKDSVGSTIWLKVWLPDDHSVHWKLDLGEHDTR
jgi:hypothetical protein